MRDGSTPHNFTIGKRDVIFRRPARLAAQAHRLYIEKLVPQPHEAVARGLVAEGRPDQVVDEIDLRAGEVDLR